MLQRVAVCCSVLQCGAVCCSVSHYIILCCTVLHCVAVRHTHLSNKYNCRHLSDEMRCMCVAVCCMYVAVCCSVLQCVAVSCSVWRFVTLCLHRVAPCCCLPHSPVQYLTIHIVLFLNHRFVCFDITLDSFLRHTSVSFPSIGLFSC